jgi:hypothetical protein
MAITRSILGATLALLLGPLTSARAGDSTVPLPVIIQKVIARDDANQRNLQSMEFHETAKTDQLGPDGSVIKHQETRMIIRPGMADEVSILSVRGDDLPSNPDEALQKAKGEEAKRKNVRFALKDMAQRFTIILAGTEVFQGQPVYVLAFTPKPDQSYHDQTEKVLNHLHGKMWISTSDYSVLKTDASLAEPVDIAWFLAQITALDFRYELHNTSGGMGPAFIQTSVAVSAPFLQFRQRMTIEMTQFQSRSGAVAAQ